MKKLFLLLLLVSSTYLQAQHRVILVIADDLGTDYFGFYPDHQDTVDVPNIRALLSKGILFTNAMANPVCSATRSGILTGQYSFRTGVGNIVGGTGGSGQLSTTEMSIPKLLQAYDTNIAKADIGKWHLNNPMPVNNLMAPLALGFDHYEGPFIGQLTSYFNWTKYTDGVASTITTYATTENVNNAETWIQTLNNRPYFLWLAFNAPHSPYHLPPANLHSYTNLSGTQQDINQNPKSYFKASLQALDTELGRLLDSLRATNQLDSTDIIFIGDNGNTRQTAQITNLDRAKGTIYQYGVHVPFIISGPSVVNPGRISNALINTTDIFATVPELFGDMTWPAQIPANKPVDSKSILPIILNQTDSIRPWSFCENFKVTPDSSDGKAMRNMDYKLIRFDYGAEEFYHLATDPNESINLLTTSNMTSEDINNYYYLCNEMTNLVGSGSYCTNTVGTSAPTLSPLSLNVSPNPFSHHIQVEDAYQNNYFILYNTLGQVVYTGNQLNQTDFSYLPQGLYILQALETNTPTLKLIKE